MTKFLKDISPLKEDLEFLIHNDERFRQYNLKREDILWPVFEEGFEGLVRILQGQQISFKGAGTLWQKLKNDLGDVTIETIKMLSVDQLKSYGFSRQKQNYLNSLISEIVNGGLCIESLAKQSNKDVILEITKIKGFGAWSAQIYLIFCLKRRDVGLQKDLVIDHALMNLYELDKRPNLADIHDFYAPWDGRLSAAMLILWQLQIYHYKE